MTQLALESDQQEAKFQNAPSFIFKSAMPMLISFSIIFALLMCGCQTGGDLGRAVVQQIALYGGHAKTSATIPELRGRWKIESSDGESFQAYMSGVSFADIQSFMQQVYGDSETLHNSPGVWYAAKNIGVAIHLVGDTNGVRFTCQRGHAYPFM